MTEQGKGKKEMEEGRKSAERQYASVEGLYSNLSRRKKVEIQACPVQCMLLIHCR